MAITTMTAQLPSFAYATPEFLFTHPSAVLPSFTLDAIAGVDSYGPLPLEALAKSAYRFSGRYISHQGGKCVTKPEVEGLRSIKRDLVLVFEDNPVGALGGAAQGRSDAQFVTQTLDALGAPRGVPVRFAYDFEITLTQWLDAGMAYLKAVRKEAAGRFTVSGYGSYALVEWAAAAGMSGSWQTLAWSYGKLSKHASLYQNGIYTSSTPYQIGGTAVDPDRGLAADYGQWDLNPSPTPIVQEEEMLIVHSNTPGLGPSLLMGGGQILKLTAAEVTAAKADGIKEQPLFDAGYQFFLSKAAD